MSKPKKYKDKDLREIILLAVYEGTTFHKKHSGDFNLINQCYQFLARDANMRKEYDAALEMYDRFAEDSVLTGSILDDIPTRVDKLGNVDLAPGYLKRAELNLNRLRWILEKRNKKYKSNIVEDMGNGPGSLCAIILPPKNEKDITGE